jgi:hypothetical protein
MFQEQRSQSKRGSRFGSNAILLKAEKVASPGYCNYIFRFLDMVFLSADNQRVPNAVWAGPVSALPWVPLSAYAADGKPAACPKGYAVQ